MLNVWILFIGELILFCAAYYFTNRDFLSPSVITVFMFLGSTICIIYNHANWNVSYRMYTTGVVLSGLSVIVITDIINRKSYNTNKYVYQEKKHESVKIIHPDHFINIMLIMGLILCLMVFYRNIQTLGSHIGVSGMQAIGLVKDSKEVSIGGIPLFCYDVIFISTFVYVFLFTNNVIVCKDRNWRNMEYFFVVLLGVVATVLRGNRGALVQIIIAIVTTSVILLRWKNGYKSIRTGLFVKKMIPIAAAVVVVFYFLREVVKGRTITTAFMDYITYYFGSPLYLFDKYLRNPAAVYSKTAYFGGTSFANLYGYLYTKGIVNAPIGILNFTPLDNDISRAGNEYTIFMRPYHDFGYVGMLIFIMIFYHIISKAYYKLLFSKCKKNTKFSLMVFSYFYFMIVMSFYYAFTAQEVRPQTLVLMMFMYVLYITIFRVRVKK